MTTVLHLVDATCDESQMQVLAALRSRAAPETWRHLVCSVNGPMAARAERHWGEKVLRAEIHAGHGGSWSARLPHVLRQTGAALLHAWGVRAAAACSGEGHDLPVAMTLLDPASAADAATWLHSFPDAPAVATGSQVTRNLLLSAGMNPERVVVIRGPVDFGAINRARQTDLRRKLVGDAGPVLLLHGPPSKAGGQSFGIWTAAVLRQIHSGLRLIMPYDSREARRLERVAIQTRMPNLLTVPNPSLNWSELVTCADVFLAPAVDEICTEPILTAMAAGLVVVGSAVRSIAELIGSGQNGLLCKPKQPRVFAGQVLNVIENDALRRRLAETARAQVYEVASLRDFADNYARLYDNLLAGRSPSDGVRDTAMVA